MGVGTAGLALLAIVLSSTALAPEPDAGRRVESESDTAPGEAARCIAYNIRKKMPELQVRSRSDDLADGSIYLVLSQVEPAPATFGVIRVDHSATGSHLTTWLPARSIAAAAPQELARRMVAGC